ncbi:hypothetical protein L6164_016755 [Bauhinia variegata]|uniref:Uncharacterized protein n=1 Tax=Bauhinia variegata TaxID=167791 RepID=A0ACB9N6E7_BAUVA|nr:hypothetical protein L6164_016755 [Bauhinia variegata]
MYGDLLEEVVHEANHQDEVKELSRWWKNLGLIEHLNFARDRIVECFMCAVGVASEPRYRSFRKWLTKAIKLVAVIDDVYDIYATFNELKQFTIAVEKLAERERGDAASSILCYMNEMSVSEEEARNHIKWMIRETWKRINEECFTKMCSSQWFVSLTTNAARVAHTLYQNGDGLGIQDRDIRRQILSLVIEPFLEV